MHLIWQQDMLFILPSILTVSGLKHNLMNLFDIAGFIPNIYLINLIF